ncbi:MAG: single-stranded DNA-binding protein [Dysgonamonadaceae bacterium]|jgi:single-strand DNA-binding protein|nr:single-stranded DNA-binding protein [Dysgonamonadaceae bacterium]
MSVNKVILVGNVGKDPEIKYFDNDNVKANFPLATSERGYTAANGTQVPERTEWHNIVCWRGLAQIVEKFVKKGSQIYLEGKIRNRSYDDQNGIKRYITEIYADNLELLNRKSAESTGGGAAPIAEKPETPETSFTSSENSGADDLPF